MKARSPTVNLTPHAFSRWCERAHRLPKTRRGLARLIETVLNNRLGGGVASVGLIVYLDMGSGVRAVLELTAQGWVALTVLGKDEPKEDGR